MIRFLLIIIILTACDSNPLGQTSFQACEHSPAKATGLPVNCQVSLPSNQGLSLWLDANDSGTLILEDQEILNSWVDKSGSGMHMTLLSGTNAKLQKKSTNNRASILFKQQGTYSIDSGSVSVQTGSDFTLAVSFKTSVVSQNSIELNNNSDFSFKINQNNELTYSLASIINQPTGIIINDNTLINMIVSYKASSKVFEITDIGNNFYYKQNSMPTTSSWANLQISGLNININEVIIYNEIVNIIELRTYLNNKWGF